MQSYIKAGSSNHPAKKLWASPELTLIGANTVNSGAAAGIHENSITASSPSIGGFHLHGPGFGSISALHNKAFYYS